MGENVCASVVGQPWSVVVSVHEHNPCCQGVLNHCWPD